MYCVLCNSLINKYITKKINEKKMRIPIAPKIDLRKAAFEVLLTPESEIYPTTKESTAKNITVAQYQGSSFIKKSVCLRINTPSKRKAVSIVHLEIKFMFI